MTVDYVVRWERGTINRFLYSIAMLAPFDEGPDDLDTSAWNGKVIYHFQGGVAIGHYQGSPSGSRMLYDTGLSRGYAVLYSTGNKTGTHYNLELGGETAIMVKDRFVSAYGLPDYTVGVGGSGGGILVWIQDLWSTPERICPPWRGALHVGGKALERPAHFPWQARSAGGRWPAPWHLAG